MLWILVTAIFAPALLTPLIFLFEKKFPAKLGLLSSLFYLTSFACICWLWKDLNPDHPVIISIPWVPAAKVNFSFVIDGLSLFFGFLASGIGVLINVYANYYMTPKEGSLSRFYCYLNLFATAMLGSVFANNLLLMFVFWETTGAMSFLLIGYFYQERKTADTSQRIFLLTSFTSLSLLMGIVLLGVLNGTFEWTDIVTKGTTYGKYGIWSYIIVPSFLLGIFGKSAQIPFHFWLPRAMVAPTPVSAYLHAATMVKLGVYLTARMYPLFVNHPIWFPALTTICYTTMLAGAVLSLLSNDMKALLAYATVSQLGFFIGFYGTGNIEGVSYDFILILNHSLYKGSLFMLAGIIYHATGIRDIRYLGGLWNKMPLTMMIFFLATAAMIGVPGTAGFLSKEVILKEYIRYGTSHWANVWILCVFITALIFKVAFSIRFFYHIFAREAEHIRLIHKPKLQILMPSLILSFLAIVFGLWPTILENFARSFFVSGLHKDQEINLAIWHGWSLEAIISIAILVLGSLLFMIAESRGIWWKKFPLLDFNAIWIRILKSFQSGSVKLTKGLLQPSPDRCISIVFGAVLAGVLPILLTGLPEAKNSSPYLLRSCTAFFMIVSTLAVPFLKIWLSKLIAISVSGFIVTLYFVLYKAPDLALTQLLVEVVSIFITLILFWFLHGKKNLAEGKTGLHLPRLFLAAGTGLTAALIAANFHGPFFSPHLQQYFLSSSIPLAHAKNAVNAVLVDFRGFDTLGEATVLVIALLGSAGLLIGQAPPWKYRPKHTLMLPSMIFSSVIPLLFFVINILAFYLLLRGHNFPGGGFIGGLASAVSFILLSLCVQQNAIFKMLSLNMVKMSLSGLLLVAASCTLPMLAGKPFLSHSAFPLLKTPLLFDTGIFLIVLGMSTMVIFSIRNTILSER